MSLETEAYEGELKQLRMVWEMLRHKDLAERLGGIFFICGESGEKDRNDLPERIHVCPAYGCDWFQIYQRTDETFGPGW